MTTIDNLKSIIETQKNTLLEFEEEIEILSNSDYIKENADVKEQLSLLKDKLSETEIKLAEASKENKGLKNALYQQVYNEKLSILNTSARKINIYFKEQCGGEVNRLSRIESNAKKKIDSITEILKDNNVSLHDEIYVKLNELKHDLDMKVTENKEVYAKEKGAYSSNTTEKYKRLKDEQITDEQIIASVKKSNWEAFIGQNIINKVGIFLIIIGVIATSQFTYFKLPDMLKCILIFALGGVMLVSGEFLNRKKPNLFSIGITAGGVAILYVGLSVSYFIYEILNMYPAITLCILITLVSLLLSKRYNSATIATFSLIGGYLPIISVTESISLIWGAMAYFIILNLLMLSLSFHRKWITCYFIGLVLNCFGTAFLIFSITVDSENILNAVISILYILAVFGIYTAIPLITCYTQKLKFIKSDIVLIGINTVISSLIMYLTFYKFDLDDYMGLLAIIFAIIYILVGHFVEKKLPNEKKAKALFYLTGFAFVVLIVPLQFEKMWLSLGWLAEGIALIVYGILKEIKSLKKGGYIIGAFCLAAFVLVDIAFEYNYLFAYKYFAITLGSMMVLCAYIYKKTLSSSFEKMYKYVSLINLWVYCLYVINIEVTKLISSEIFDEHYLTSVFSVVASFVIAFIMPRIKILYDHTVKLISNGIVSLSIIGLFIINWIQEPLKIIDNIPLSSNVLLALIISVTGILSVFALYDMVKSFIVDEDLGVEWLPLIVSAYIVIVLTQNLTLQFHMSFTSMFISIIYAVTAFIWIVLGFVKRFNFIRKFGLGLSILSVVKLFVLDLSYLTEGSKIVSYFALGISLIAISFVYQYFSKRLEIKGGIVSDE